MGSGSKSEADPRRAGDSRSGRSLRASSHSSRAVEAHGGWNGETGPKGSVAVLGNAGICPPLWEYDGSPSPTSRCGGGVGEVDGPRYPQTVRALLPIDGQAVLHRMRILWSRSGNPPEGPRVDPQRSVAAPCLQGTALRHPALAHRPCPDSRLCEVRMHFPQPETGGNGPKEVRVPWIESGRSRVGQPVGSGPGGPS